MNHTETNNNLKKISKLNEKKTPNKIIEIKKSEKFKRSHSFENNNNNNIILSNKINNSISNTATGNTSDDFRNQGKLNSKGSVLSDNFEKVEMSKKKKKIYTLSPKLDKRKIKIKNNVNNNLIKSQNLSYNNYKIEDISNYTRSLLTEIFSQNNNKINAKINTCRIQNNEIQNKKLLNSKNDYIYLSIDSNDEKENIKNSKKVDIFHQSTEEKIQMSITKLDYLSNPKEKLLVFIYLFNNFNEILNDYIQKNISQSTLKKYISIHIDNLKDNDNLLLEQIIKNLMRMVFYMHHLFDIYNVENILKFILFSLYGNNDDNLIKLSNELLEIIRKKFDNEEIFKTIYCLLKEYNSNHDACYEFLGSLIPECDSILNNINYFKQFFRIICLTEVESNKIGKIIDILYRKYSANFTQSYKEENEYNQHRILYFMEKSNSFYFREFKCICQENEKSKTLNLIDEVKEDNKENTENHAILQEYKIKDEHLSNDDCRNNPNKKISTNDNVNNTNETNPNMYIVKNTSNLNLTNNSKKQSTKCTNGIYNSLGKEVIPNEIKTAVEKNSPALFLDYINKHNDYIPSFLFILTNSKFFDVKYMGILLIFTEKLINSNNHLNENNSYIELLIKQLITLLIAFKNDKNLINLILKLLNEIPVLLNPENYFISINKYLQLDVDIFVLENLLQIIKDYIVNSKNIEIEKLIKMLIKNIFNLLNHKNSEIRKRVVYCCVEIYMIIGKEFETYMNNIPKAQQNLIKFYIKKRKG